MNPRKKICYIEVSNYENLDTVKPRYNGLYGTTKIGSL